MVAFVALCGRLAAVSLGAMLILAAGHACAQSTAPLDPEKMAEIRAAQAACLACHSPQGLKAPPREGMDLKKLATMIHDVSTFQASSHGRVKCALCHGPATASYPHAATAKSEVSPCSECHATKVLRIEMQFDASVHAKNLKDKFTCWSCHDPHVYNIAAKIGAPKAIVTQDNTMCLDCHNSDLQFSKFAPVNKRRPNIDQIHDWLPNTKMHWQAVRCVECHTPAGRAFSHEIQDKTKAERNCVSCHTQESSLRTRLYRHLVAEEQQTLGFVNSVFLPNAYVVGATRNPWLDTTMLSLAALTLAGVLGHGGLRILVSLWRRRRGG